MAEVDVTFEHLEADCETPTDKEDENEFDLYTTNTAWS